MVIPHMKLNIPYQMGQFYVDENEPHCTHSHPRFPLSFKSSSTKLKSKLPNASESFSDLHTHLNGHHLLKAPSLPQTAYLLKFKFTCILGYTLLLKFKNFYETAKQNNNDNNVRALITEAAFPEVIAKSLHSDLLVENRTFGPTVRLRSVLLSP